MTERKKKILILLPVYLPGYKSGGPIRTISNIVNACSDHFEFSIICKDRDAGDFDSYENISIDDWNKVGASRVFYASENKRNYFSFYDLIKVSDSNLVYLNSFFNYNFTLRPLLINILFHKKPVLLCPRGELSDGALNIKSLKKQFYIKLFKLIMLHKRVTWQATSRQEEREIRKVFGRSVDVWFSENIARPKIAELPFPAKPKTLRVVFLSRISKKKNLLGAIQALKFVSARVQFNVYGPASRDEDIYYLNRCKSIVEELPENIKVSFCGDVPNHKVGEVLKHHDLFFLPTEGENFGHVIFEALASGLPLLISNTTPWERLEQFGIGWNLGVHDYEGYANYIDKVAAMPASEHSEFRFRALQFAKNYLISNRSVADTKNMFSAVANEE